MPAQEALYSFMPETFKTLDNAFGRFFFIQSGFGVKLIGIANYLFFQRLRNQTRKSGTGVAFGYTGMAKQTLGTKHLGPNDAVTQVRLLAKALNARRISLQDANIVEHGGFEEKGT